MMIAAPWPAAAAAVTVVALCASGCGASSRIRVTAPPPHAPPLAVGIVANTLDAGRRRGEEQHQVRQLGVRWIREELRWPDVEPQPGVFRWESFDRLLSTSTANGLHVLPLLIGTPSWAGPAELALPNDPRQFGEFAGQVAARYGPGGVFWRQHPRLDQSLAPQWFELWNEPYSPAFTNGAVDPARYAQMVVAAGTAGRAANPRTRWLMAADYLYGPASARSDWLTAMYTAEPQLNQGFDGVAVHPYSFYGPTAGPSAAALAFRFDRIGAIWTELAAHGAGNKPIWITELGWSTCATRPDCVSEHDQAQFFADAFAQLHTRYANVVRALFVYHLYDFSSGQLDNSQDHFGLLRANSSRKPSWHVIRLEARYASR
jgi:Beta-galactosidase